MKELTTIEEMVAELEKVFEVNEVNYITTNGKPDGKHIGADLYFFSGLVISLNLNDEKHLIVKYGHLPNMPTNKRQINERNCVIDIFDMQSNMLRIGDGEFSKN
jgi:hypothetical protein